MFLKNLLIGSVFKGISGVNQFIPKNDQKILLYSDLGFRDNVKYLYDYLIQHNYNEKYQIICAVKGYQKFTGSAPKNVVFTRPFSGIFAYLRTTHVFYCFGKLPISATRKQKVIQMWHGTSFKGFAQNQTQTGANANSFYTYVYASSPYFVPIVARKFNVDRNHVAICGHPRTDVFYEPKANYALGDFKKILVWLPTFRQSKRLGQTDTKQDSILPFLADSELAHFNDYLQEKDVKVIVKLHPMQDVSEIDHAGWKNLVLMSNSEFEKSGMDLYRLLNLSDGLLTDYSSVFYDYLLLDKPIGFTESDVEEYEKKRGFAVDPDKFRPGQRIRQQADLRLFIENVITGNDAFKPDRKKINLIANRNQNGTNSEQSLKLSDIHM